MAGIIKQFVPAADGWDAAAAAVNAEFGVGMRADAGGNATRVAPPGGGSAAAAAPSAAGMQQAFFTNTDVLNWETIPWEVRAKLREIRDTAADVHAASRPLFEEMADLRLRRHKVEAYIRELASQLRSPDDDPAVVRERAKLAALDERIEHNAAREEKIIAKWRPLAELKSNLEAYLRDAACHTMAIYTGAEPEPRKSEKPLAAWQRSCRRVRELRDEIKQIQAAPYRAVDAKQRLDAWLDRLAEQGKPDVTQMVDYNGDIRLPQVSIPMGGHVLTPASPMVAGTAQQDNAIGLLAWLFRDAVREALHQQIDVVSDDAAALSHEDRARRMTETKDDLLAVEREAEHWFCRASSEGADIARAPDSDPRAVLGLICDFEPQRR